MRLSQWRALLDADADAALLRLQRTPAMDWPEQPVDVDPRFLGMWLRDGARNSPTIFNFDEDVVIESREGYAKGLGMDVVYHGNLRYAIVDGANRTRATPWPFPLLVDRRTRSHPHQVQRQKNDRNAREKSGTGRGRRRGTDGVATATSGSARTARASTACTGTRWRSSPVTF